MKVLVTGGCGFVGSNVVKKLNQDGVTDIIIVDNYDEKKLKNIRLLQFSDYFDYNDGIKATQNFLKSCGKIDLFLHIGANADVLETDIKKVMHENYEFSKSYFEFCCDRNIPFFYASTSAIYGNSKRFSVQPENEDPHNAYAWSKWLFDKYIMANMHKCNNRVIGFRFFNVFGNGELHKGKNACIANRFVGFIKELGYIDLFKEKITRDYIWAPDLAEIMINVNKDDTIKNGIYNLGSGDPISHREIAEMVVKNYTNIYKSKSDIDELIKEISMPDHLVGKFQFFTCAEDLLPVVSQITTNNREKMNNYIKQLLQND
jgi:ADP-L-glycero-D-manno-heptose 6-epimerase